MELVSYVYFDSYLCIIIDGSSKTQITKKLLCTYVLYLKTALHIFPNGRFEGVAYPVSVTNCRCERFRCRVIDLACLSIVVEDSTML